MNAAVFLDRDNTLIHNDGDLGAADKVRLIMGAASAVASFRGLGYKVVVVTNQGGVARGLYGEPEVEAVHRKINELIRGISGAWIDRFYFCPYHPEAVVERYRGDHAWRKPRAGMLLQAAKDLGLDLAQSWMVGDQARDIDAGAAAGCRTILLTPAAEELSARRLEQLAAEGPPGEAKPGRPHYQARSVVEAARIIAWKRKPETPEETRARERIVKRAEIMTSPPGSRPAAAPTASVPAALPAAPTAPGVPAPSAVPAASTPAEAISPVSPVPAASSPVAGTVPRRSSPPPVRGADVVDAEAAPPAEAEEPPRAVAGAAVVAEEPLSHAEPLPTEDSPPPAEAPSASPTEPEAAGHEATLRQILTELRHQRALGDDFSYAQVLAIVIEMVVAVCFLGGLWMGHRDDGLFLRWIACGVLLQLAVIAILLASLKGR